MEDISRLDYFVPHYLKQSGDLKDKSIQRWHLATDILASGVFASGVFNGIHPVGGPYETYITLVNREPWDSVLGPIGQNPPILVENYNTGYGMQVRNYCNDPVGGTGAGIQVVVMGDNVSNGIYVVNQSTTAKQFGINIDNNGTGMGIMLYNIGTGVGMNISQWDTASLGVAFTILNCVNNPAGNVTTPAAFKGINIFNVPATGGYGMSILNKGTATGGTGIEIVNGESAAGESIGLYVRNDSSNYGVKIQHDAGDAGLFLNGTCATTPLLITQNGAAPCVVLFQSGLGYDITGTSSAWYVDNLGNAVFNSVYAASYSGAGLGTSGYSGYSGISGYSGYSGSGASGYSGSGFSGYSGVGTSGYSGYSGYSGTSGYSGYSGISGYSGLNGSASVSGYSGYSGYSSISGYSGYSGISGYSGYSSISGYSGYSGISGYSGQNGITSASGVFDIIKIDGPVPSGCVLTSDSDGWGTWQSPIPINVRNFGAKGDGVTDDTAAIQNAVNSSSDAGCIFFPPGIYIVGKEGSTGGAKEGLDMFCIELKNNITLYGCGSASIIKLAQQHGSATEPYPAAFIVWAGNFTRPPAMGPSYTNNGKKNLTTRNIKLDCDLANQPSGGTHNICNINISECSYIRIQDCELTGGVAETCYILGQHIDEDQTALFFLNNYVHDTGEWGVDALGVHMDRISGGVCANNNFENIGLRAIGCALSSKVAITGNRIGKNYDGGIRCPGSTDLLIANNTIYDSNKYGIEISPEGAVDADDITITGNKIYGNSVNGQAGIFVLNASNIMINNNKVKVAKFDGSASGNLVHGICVKIQNNATSSNIAISNNMVDNIDPGYTGSGLEFAPAGIAILGQDDTHRVTYVTVTGNNVNNCYNGIFGQHINKLINGSNFFYGSTNANSTLSDDVIGVASCATDNNNIQ